MTDWKKPAWYLTPQEFADIIVNSLEDNNYFKRNEKAHPVDIEAAFSTTASAVAHAIDAIGKKIHDAEKTDKKAMMMPKDLNKNITITSSSNIEVAPSTISYGDENAADYYFEQKYGKIKK
jgi:chaperonin GroEL (HSP60 family)